MESEKGQKGLAGAPVGTELFRVVRAFQKTDIGKRREENQDSIGSLENDRFKLYIVADGMGGVKGGALASALALETIRENLKSAPLINEHTISEAILKANTRIFEEALTKPALTGMGTTVVMILISGNDTYLAHVGDSRAYQIRDGAIQQLTDDHTLVMELIKSGAITPEQAHNHPVSHMLTRSLGPTPEVQVDCRKLTEFSKPGDRILLCSDGLYNLVTESEIVEILGTNSVDDALTKMVDLANERGGPDNISIIVAEVPEEEEIEVEEVPEVVETTPVAPKAKIPNIIELTTLASATNGHSNGAIEKEQDSITTAPHGSSENPEHSDANALPPLPPRTPVLKRPYIYVVFFLGLVFGGFTLGVLPRLLNSSIMTDLQELENHAKQPPRVTPRAERAKDLAALLNQLPPPSQAPVEVKIPVELQQPPVEQATEVVAQVTQVVQAVQPAEQQQEVSPTEPPPPVVQQEAPPPRQDMRIRDHDSVFTAEQRVKIHERRKSLKLRIADLSAKIQSFEEPLSGDIGSRLHESEQVIAKSKSDLEEVKRGIDIATRKLAVWYDRKNDLAHVDPINLAQVVEVSSDAVRLKNKEFKETTAQYIAEKERLQYDPQDNARRARVDQLVKDRRAQLNELAVLVKVAIDEEIAKADKDVAELAVRRDRIQEQLHAAEREIEYGRVLMSDDATAKGLMVQRLRSEQAQDLDELDSLNQLIPDDDGAVVNDPEARG